MTRCLAKVLAVQLIGAVNKMNFHQFFLPDVWAGPKTFTSQCGNGDLFDIDEAFQFVM